MSLPCEFRLVRGAESLTCEDGSMVITGVTHGIVVVNVTPSATAETTIHELSVRLKPWANALEGCTFVVDEPHLEKERRALDLLHKGTHWKASSDREKGIHVEFTGEALETIIRHQGTLQLIDYYR